MIVTDTNVVAYLMLPSRHTALSERLLGADPDWIAPVLWRSEMRNVLALYMRKGLVSLEDALNIQMEAEALLRDREYEVDTRDVLALVHRSSRSAYDCEFVALARRFDVPLVTMDGKVIDAFPETAISPDSFISGTSIGTGFRPSAPP